MRTLKQSNSLKQRVERWLLGLRRGRNREVICLRVQRVSFGLQWDPIGQSKGNQLWIFIVRTDAKAEAPMLWPPDGKNWLISKDPDARKDWRQEEKGTTENEMVGRHHQLNGHEFEQAPGVGDGRGSLACYSPWDRKEVDMTEWLSWTELTKFQFFKINKS